MKRSRGRPVEWPWERHFFWLAAHVLACKLALRNGGRLPDGHVYVGVDMLVGELGYGHEMALVLKSR
jgi:hypothetical protein